MLELKNSEYNWKQLSVDEKHNMRIEARSEGSAADAEEEPEIQYEGRGAAWTLEKRHGMENRCDIIVIKARSQEKEIHGETRRDMIEHKWRDIIRAEATEKTT